MKLSLVKKMTAIVVCLSMVTSIFECNVHAAYTDSEGKTYEPVDSTHHSITTVDEEGTSSTVNEECSFGDDGKCKCGNEKCKHTNTKLEKGDKTHHNVICSDCGYTVNSNVECNFSSGNTCECGNTKQEETISLDRASASIKVGESVTITATVSSGTASFTSSNTSVATVDSSGKVTGVKAGTATITATANGKSASCDITVTANESGSSSDATIALSGTTTITVGENTTINVVMTPSDAKISSAVSSDTSVAAVSVGGNSVLVKGIKAGTSKITVKSDNGKESSTTITVKAADQKYANDALLYNEDGEVLYVYENDEYRLARFNDYNNQLFDRYYIRFTCIIDGYSDWHYIYQISKVDLENTGGEFDYHYYKIPGTMNVGQSIPIIAWSNSDARLLKWELDDSGIATLKDNVLTANKMGTVKVTAFFSDGCIEEEIIEIYASPSSVNVGGSCGTDTYWYLDGKGVLSITGFGEMYDFDYDSGIMSPWYYYKKNIFSVEISDGVTSIGDYAFYDLSAIEKLKLPDSLERIGRYSFDSAFRYKRGGKHCDIYFPRRLKYIDDGAFRYASIGKIEFEGESLVEIGYDSFQGSDITGDIIIPDGVKVIGESAFADCTELDGTIVIPQSVESIGNNLIDESTYVKKVNNKSQQIMNLPKLDGRVWVNENDTSKTVKQVKAGTVVSVSELDRGKVISGQCGENITYTLRSDGVLRIQGNGEMYDFEHYDTSAPWSEYRDFITELELSDEITHIGNSSFFNCYRISDLKLPASLKSIGSYAFGACKGLQGELEIPNGVEIIDTYAFGACRGLTGSLKLPKDLKRLGYEAFYYCVGIKNIEEIPVSLIDVGKCAFGGLESMDGMVVIPSNIHDIPEGLFEYCSNLEKVIIEEGVESIDFFAFSNCRSLRTIEIPSTVSLVAENAFNKAGSELTIVCEKDSYIYNWAIEHGYNVSTDGSIDNSIRVRFDSTVDNIKIPSQIFEPGSMVTEPKTPFREGYEFLGWYQDDTKFDFSKRVYENIMLRARWKELPKLEKPTINYEDGSPLINGACVKVYSQTPGVDIYYTLDGSTPTTNSGQYSESIPLIGDIGTFITLKLIAVKGGYISSDVSQYSFLITSADSDTLIDVLPSDVPQGNVSNIPKSIWIAGIDEDGYTYTGAQIRPNVRVYYYKTLLTEKVDYTLSYLNNTNAADEDDDKAPRITVIGKGNYAGSIYKKFKINKKKFSDDDITYEDIIVSYNKKLQKISPKVYRSNKKLRAGTDYSVTYPKTDSRKPDYDKTAFVDVGTYEIMIRGEGNYEGNITVHEKITDATLMSKASVSTIKNQIYSGEGITLDTIVDPITVKYGKKTLKEGTHYTVSYKNNIEVGTATVILTGTGASTPEGTFIGEKLVNFKIIGTALSKAKISNWTKEYVYDGGNQEQDAVFTYNDITLVEGEDYTVSYTNNTNAGTATAIYTGINGYSGIVKKTFKIRNYNIYVDNRNAVSVDYKSEYCYEKGGIKPLPVVIFGGNTLEYKKDYTLSYKNCNSVNGGDNLKNRPTMYITGKGNFTGKIEISEFTICHKDISELDIQVADIAYSTKKNGWKSIPTITDVNGKALKSGTDYLKNIEFEYCNQTVLENGDIRGAGEDVISTDIVPMGTDIKVTVSGCGNYEGEIVDVYKVGTKNFNSASIKIKDQTFTGSNMNLKGSDITVKIGIDDLVLGTDYEIAGYSNCINKGTGIVTLRGIGKYAGTKNVKVKIVAGNMKDLISMY